MTLQTYIDNLKQLAKARPELLKMPVIYSVDDEGNRFQHVHYAPTPGGYDDSTGEFNDAATITNATCIN